MEWSRPAPAVSPTAPPFLRRAFGHLTDWEDWLTLALVLAGTLSVTTTLEAGGWSKQMPPITLVSVLAAFAALFLARSALPLLLAWPLAFVTGVLVVSWQTLEMVGPGTSDQRLDAVYLRFKTWFDIAINGGVSNDSLPFNVLVIGLTWLGVFLFGWSVYRWHNAWIGLLPGAATLFVDVALVGDPLTAAAAAYIFFGFLLVMRTNLTARMARWRADGASYPPMVSLTFLNFSGWVLLFLMVAAWIAPVGPFATPAPVQSLVERVTGAGVDFVRLAGPMHVKKIIPVHNYTGVLPFQGSVDLGDRQVLAVRIEDPALEGPIALRGAVYEKYGSGGWEAGERNETGLPGHIDDRLREEIQGQERAGFLVPIRVTVTAKSVVGSVLFSPGQPAASDTPVRVDAPDGSLGPAYVSLPDDGEGMPDSEVLSTGVPDNFIGMRVDRDEEGRVASVDVFDVADQAVPDSLVLRPGDHLEKGDSYRVTGFVPAVTPEDLRAAGARYPAWVTEQYLQLPDSLPDRVRDRAHDVAGGEPTAYDKAKAIEDILRQYTLDYQAGVTPTGEDTVDYFLFESQRGYFDYHASAMVVMLRAAGVPSRLAVGYVIDEGDFDAEKRAYAVRDSDSYAWAEVYFPRYGWIPFNPSPDEPADLWPTKVVDNTPAIDPLVGGFVDEPVGADPIFDTLPRAGPLAGTPPSGGGSGEDYQAWLIVAAVIGFAGALAGSAALGWRRSVAGLPYSQQLWEKTVRLATWAGYPPESGQTPSDFTRRLERAFRGVRDLPALAAAYGRSRFGGRDAAADEREMLRQMWPHLRGTLLRAIALRLVRRRRPY